MYSLNMINYEALVIIGLFFAIITILMIITVFTCWPVGIILYINYLRNRRDAQEARRSFIHSIFKVTYSKKSFGTIEDCPVCLEDFKEGDKVSPMPCDVRHVFHTSCVKKWLKKQHICPLCKKGISE